MLDLDEWKNRLEQQLATETEWEAAFCSTAHALRRSISAQPHDIDPALFTAADHLRHLWISKWANEESWRVVLSHAPYWQCWQALTQLYAHLAAITPHHNRFRPWLAQAMQRTAWCLLQAFLTLWRLPAQPPSWLWKAVYRLWESAARQRVLWRKVPEPLSPDDKQSTHEALATVLLLQLLDPARLARAEFVTLNQLAEHYAIFLQLVPPFWVTRSDDHYAIQPARGCPPRGRGILPPATTEPLVLETEALTNRLLADMSEMASAKESDAQDRRHWLKKALAGWAHHPVQRRTPRETIVAQLHCYRDWQAIYAMFAGQAFSSPHAVEVTKPFTESQRIRLFGETTSEIDREAARWAKIESIVAPWRSVWQQIDGSTSGCMAIATTLTAEDAIAFEPGMLLALQWVQGAELSPPRLARLRWRQYAFVDEMRIGVEFFPFAHLSAAAIRANVRVGEPEAPWLPALIAESVQDPQRLAVIAPREALQHLWSWELWWQHRRRLLEYDDLVEEGRDYLWLVCRVSD